MSELNRRRFLVLTGAGVVAVTGGGIAFIVSRLAGSQKSALSFRAVTGLPAKPLLSYASYVVAGNVNMGSQSGTITLDVYAGPPEAMTNISLFTRAVRVTAVRQDGGIWHISGVADNQAQLQKGEDTSFELQVDSSSSIASSTFFGSPVQLSVQKFSVS